MPDIRISDYDYDLPEERIAKFPVAQRDAARLLVSRKGEISQKKFAQLGEVLPERSLLVFNNTRVIRARIVMHKPSGARIELFCLEPHEPADYERAFAARSECVWRCMVGNSKKWKEGALEIVFDGGRLEATRAAGADEIRFRWDADLTFGQLLEHLGRIPIPPYLGRESEEVDNSRYQTVYSRFEGSVAAPTAGLHFTPELLENLRKDGTTMSEVTLHVGAGTFLPVKSDAAVDHHMHTERFEISAELLESLISYAGGVTAVGTTTVRTLESLTGLGYRVLQEGAPDAERAVGQWELYDIPPSLTGAELLAELLAWMRSQGIGRLKTATQIMIMPGFRFRIVDSMITNFHQPRSTLLLLVSAFVGDHWREAYDYALANDFRFLSYGDSSIFIK
ncbi:MAG: S-adenosylmethionine:tRNA ribosyltransferase-isomerase [Rikenellaceae bacterium]|nr:S-adenosylmethionine:tRNA ribosyltransferase-isomerase [Rikenellaceae bacterium]MCL2693220.1 S-adenosylmethionine:tRNA ribosyltransferase-isomerase [Rikenellaceae bacterium]